MWCALSAFYRNNRPLINIQIYNKVCWNAWTIKYQRTKMRLVVKYVIEVVQVIQVRLAQLWVYFWDIRTKITFSEYGLWKGSGRLWQNSNRKMMLRATFAKHTGLVRCKNITKQSCKTYSRSFLSQLVTIKNAFCGISKDIFLEKT